MISRELFLFSIIGALTVLIDFLIYSGVVWSGWATVNIAKGSGFLAGTIFAFFANRSWTFGDTRHRAGSPIRFGMLYMITLGGNVLVNAIVLRALGDARSAVQMAFLFATGVSSSLNFIGMKWFVFRASGSTESR